MGSYLDNLTARKLAEREVEEIEGWRVERAGPASWHVYFSFEDLKAIHEAQWNVNIETRSIIPANRWARELSDTR